MPTNNIKHRMLIDAKRIANTEFKGYFLTTEDGNQLWISPKIVRDARIYTVLEEHPEYDPNEFREMIKKAGQINKERKLNFISE